MNNVSPSGDNLLSEFSKSTIFSVWTYCRITLGKFIPIVGIVIANGILIKVTWISKPKDKTPVTVTHVLRKTAHNRMTAMLIGISFTFVVCHILEPLLQIYVENENFNIYSKSANIYFTLVMLTTVLEAFSFTNNIVFYCLFNTHFKTTIQKIFVCRVRVRIQCTENRLNSVKPFSF